MPNPVAGPLKTALHKLYNPPPTLKNTTPATHRGRSLSVVAGAPQHQNDQESSSDIGKLHRFLPNRPVEHRKKLLEGLKGVSSARKLVVAAHKNDDGYVLGVNLKKLARLSELFPGVHINSLTVCLLNNSKLLPETLRGLCTIFPKKSPEQLSGLANGEDFNPEAVEEAVRQKLQFLDEKIVAGDVASGLRLVAGASLRSLSELSAKYPGNTVSQCVANARLEEVFPNENPNEIRTALERVENSGVVEFTTLVKKRIISRGDGAGNFLQAIEQYRRYKGLMGHLHELFPDDASLDMSAWRTFVRGGRSANVDEFAALVRDGTIVSGNSLAAVVLYVQYKERGPHRQYKDNRVQLQTMFPTAPPWMIAHALKTMKQIRHSSFDEFERLIRDNTVSRGIGDGNPIFAVNRYREYKKKLG